MFRSGYSVSLCCSVYCLCVNVYCTAANGCQHICSQQIYQETHSEVVQLLVHEGHPQAVGPVLQEPFEVCEGQSRVPHGEVCYKACGVAAEEEHPSEVYRHEECAQRS